MSCMLPMGKYREAGARNYRSSSSLHKLFQMSSDWLGFALSATKSKQSKIFHLESAWKCLKALFSSREFFEIIFRWITTHEQRSRESQRSNLGAGEQERSMRTLCMAWYGTLSSTKHVVMGEERTKLSIVVFTFYFSFSMAKCWSSSER